MPAAVRAYNTPMLPATRALSHFGHSTLITLDGLGRFAIFSLAALRIAVFEPMSWLRWSNLAPQLYSVGAASVLVVAITGAFIGMILALEGYDQFAALGQEQQMGGVINAAVTKQIGPVLAAVMLAGRVGGSLAAELGSMRVTEQLDAMRAMAADPIRTLVVPRVVACVLMTPLLTIYSDVVGSLGAWARAGLDRPGAAVELLLGRGAALLGMARGPACPLLAAAAPPWPPVGRPVADKRLG